jgi:hypothetical protein
MAPSVIVRTAGVVEESLANVTPQPCAETLCEDGYVLGGM